MRVRRLVLVLPLTIAAACSSGSDSTPPLSLDTTFATTTTLRPDDGVLHIGVLRPTEGNATTIGQSIEDAVQLAVTEINAAGGVNDQDVRTTVVDEGTTAAAAVAAVDELLEAGVDAIVGPSSSTVALGGLAHIVESGVTTCSPTASALALDAFPDDGMFFRTIPSDSLQASAIAQAVEGTGARGVTLAFLNDVYGRPFADAVRTALSRRGISVTSSQPFNADEASIRATAQAIATVDAPVVVVIADATTGPALVQATDDLSSGSPQYVVNDSFRRTPLTNPYSTRLARRIVGVAPAAMAPKPFLDSLLTIDAQATGVYATNAYDCVNLVALAAQAAGSSQPRSIAAGIVIASASGSPCQTFAACNDSLIAGRNIDYDGPSGALDLGVDGDPTRAVFEQFAVDDSGRDSVVAKLTVGRQIVQPG